MSVHLADNGIKNLGLTDGELIAYLLREAEAHYKHRPLLARVLVTAARRLYKNELNDEVYVTLVKLQQTDEEMGRLVEQDLSKGGKS